MFGRPLHRRCAAWLALLAVLWGALVPTLAQAAVSTSSRQGWVEVCSASGVLWMRVDGGAQSPTSQPGSMADASAHCPWCPMQGAAGLPPEPALTTAVCAQGPVPTAAFTSARPALLWSKAQSRAPPAA
ncbi:MAG: DUF2946 domain-containing protein [Burkholderiales bacterium]|nr:MAG: DUF2946 domain-containing protein [Burkholderiales bacterium]